MTVDQKTRMWLERFRNESKIISTMINNNKDNDLFRLAWKVFYLKFNKHI